jgi:Fe-S-cluster containining protein
VSRVEQIFSCKRCGYCCKGETTVSLNEDDQKHMVEVLGKSTAQVNKLYWKVTQHCVQMKTVDGHCVFYDNGCRVHAGRPWRCAQWPLHPSILLDKNNFHTISDSCPGINKEISYEKFCVILRELMEDSVVSC